MAFGSVSDIYTGNNSLSADANGVGLHGEPVWGSESIGGDVQDGGNGTGEGGGVVRTPEDERAKGEGEGEGEGKAARKRYLSSNYAM